LHILIQKRNVKMQKKNLSRNIKISGV